MSSNYRSILHPSDLEADSRPAFQHSLALTLACQGNLCISHSQDPYDEKMWLDFLT